MAIIQLFMKKACHLQAYDTLAFKGILQIYKNNISPLF